MPLPLLAAAATQAATLFSYNRQNFLYDRGQRVQRAFTGFNYRLQQFALYRQDIRDLVGLTTDKMSNYHVVACLELGMCATLMGPARLPEDVPEWVLWHQLISLCAAFAYLVMSMWFATRAAVAADSFNVRLQTQWIRLPLPDDELLDSALTRAEAFESEGLSDMLRVPMMAGLYRRVFNRSGQEENESLLGSDAGEACRTGTGSGSPLGIDSFSALQLYQQLQRNWSCYDAYARVAMSVGTYWLALSLAYYEIGWTLCHQGKLLPAVVAASTFAGVIMLLVYLDIFVSRSHLALIASVVASGPALVSLGAALGGAEAQWCAVAVGIVHTALTLWLWHAGSIVPGKADLPTRFKGVVYLDIFGPIVQQIRHCLDSTGLGQHAVGVDEEASPNAQQGNAARAAQAIGLAEETAHGEVLRLRRVLRDYRDGGTAPRLSEAQRVELQRMSEAMDAAHRSLLRLDDSLQNLEPAEASGCTATARLKNEPPTILRTLSAGGGLQPCAEKGAADVGCKGCQGEALPRALANVAFEDLQALCADALARAERTAGEIKLAEEVTSRHRKGHQPVVAYKAMCAVLVSIWLVGTLVHLTQVQPVRVAAGRRLSSVEAFAWPEPFFRARDLHCLQAANASSLGLVASNGFVVYRLASRSSEAAQLSCAVAEHDALVSSTEGQAIVAASGSLWECRQGEPAAAPLASLSHVGERLIHWAGAGQDVLFAAPQHGSIVELRWRGGEVVPIAELQPAGEWLGLLVLGDLLVGVAGSNAVVWSLVTGELLGTRPWSAGGALGWCATEGGSLYGAWAAEGGLELSPASMPARE